MKKIRDLVKRIENGYNNQERELNRIIQDNEKELLDLNKQQLFKGETAFGDSIGEYQSESYAKYKLMLNPLGVVDLMNTGSFYDHFFIKRYKFPIQIDSNDSKRTSIVKKYTDSIFGLGKESIGIFAQGTAKKEFTAYWKKILHV